MADADLFAPPPVLAEQPGLYDALLQGLQAPALPDALHQRLRQRVLSDLESLYAIVKRDDDGFLPFLPGVALRPLRVDVAAWTQTSLWRLDPGAKIPPHRHSAEEECLILEGSLVWGGVEYGAGDFLLAHPGAHHDEFLAPRGALLMIRSELTEPLRRLFSA